MDFTGIEAIAKRDFPLAEGIIKVTGGPGQDVSMAPADISEGRIGHGIAQLIYYCVFPFHSKRHRITSIVPCQGIIDPCSTDERATKGISEEFPVPVGRAAFVMKRLVKQCKNGLFVSRPAGAYMNF